MIDDSVFRVVHGRAKKGCAPALEELLRAMLNEASGFPGYMSAELITPEDLDGEYQTVVRFATEADLHRWNVSGERLSWTDKLLSVTEGKPVYRLLNGLEVWFGPAVPGVKRMPPIWRMTLIGWLGVFPMVLLLINFVSPHLKTLPLFLRTAITTALGSVLMSYIVMPLLTRCFGRWLRR